MNFRKVENYAAPVRLGLFLLSLLLFWLPAAVPAYIVFGAASGTYLGILLYLLFVVGIGVWGRRVAQKSQPYAHYGLFFSRITSLEWLAGNLLGLLSLFSLMQLQVSLGWLSWQNVSWLDAVGPGFLTGLGVGFAEELLFRGWLLTELEQDYGKTRSLWLSSNIFALLHFIKPLEVVLASWVQYPGLVLLGMDLVWARRSRQGRLGLAMGLHGGLVWGYYIINTTHWLKSAQRVPEWVTGIGSNPLAGVMGLLFLSAIGGVIGIVLKFALKPADQSTRPPVI